MLILKGVIGSVLGIGGFVISVVSLPFTIPTFVLQYEFPVASMIGMSITIVGVLVTMCSLTLFARLSDS